MYRLLKRLLKTKRILLLLVLACIGRSVAFLFINRGYMNLIDSLTVGTKVFNGNDAIFLISIGILQVAIIFSQYVLSSQLSEKTSLALRDEAIEGILKADYKKIETLSTGESLSKLNTDLSGVTAWIKNEFPATIFDSISFIIILSAMLYTNWKLTVLSFFIVPFFSIGSYFFSKPITRAEKDKNKAVADVNSISKSILDAFPVLKLFGMKQPLLDKSNEKIDQSIQAEIKANSIRAKLMSVNGFFSYTPSAILWGVGGYMAITGNLTPGALLAYINLSSFVTTPLLNLPARIDAMRTSSANVSRVFELLEHISNHVKGGDSMVSTNSHKIAIEFKDVTFGYSGDKSSLEHVSFQVHEGDKVAIVGESGCGKSTILKLIAGFYNAYEGEILLSGIDLKHASLNAIRGSISFVPQEPQLFPMSIYENITCGHVMSKEKVMNACQDAQLYNCIQSLPEGIHTNIGEYGNKLSGGERQRICIARAIAKDAPLYLLDEATSSLDGQTESTIVNYFDSLIRTKTIVFVTHKIKNAVNADLILCMKNGRICECGTHESLLIADGYYAKLFKLQNMVEVLNYEEIESAVG